MLHEKKNPYKINKCKHIEKYLHSIACNILIDHMCRDYNYNIGKHNNTALVELQHSKQITMDLFTSPQQTGLN